jgi:hypothetical protein
MGPFSPALGAEIRGWQPGSSNTIHTICTPLLQLTESFGLVLSGPVGSTRPATCAYRGTYICFFQVIPNLSILPPPEHVLTECRVPASTLVPVSLRPAGPSFPSKRRVSPPRLRLRTRGLVAGAIVVAGILVTVAVVSQTAAVPVPRKSAPSKIPRAAGRIIRARIVHRVGGRVAAIGPEIMAPKAHGGVACRSLRTNRR